MDARHSTAHAQPIEASRAPCQERLLHGGRLSKESTSARRQTLRQPWRRGAPRRPRPSTQTRRPAGLRARAAARPALAGCAASARCGARAARGGACHTRPAARCAPGDRGSCWITDKAGQQAAATGVQHASAPLAILQQMCIGVYIKNIGAANLSTNTYTHT